eukprot:scaffold21632_cov62-Phaeocystis_antarctica.AAC.1
MAVVAKVAATVAAGTEAAVWVAAAEAAPQLSQSGRIGSQTCRKAGRSCPRRESSEPAPSCRRSPPSRP